MNRQEHMLMGAVVDAAISLERNKSDNLRDALRELHDNCVKEGLANKDWFKIWQTWNMVTLTENGFPIPDHIQKTWVHNPAMRER